MKILARTWPEQFLQLGFPNQPFRLIGAESNVELAMEIDRVDFLHELEINSKGAFLHIDFQLEHDNECQRRFFVYNAMLTELKKPTTYIADNDDFDCSAVKAVQRRLSLGVMQGGSGGFR